MAHPDPPHLANSLAWWERAVAVIPLGTQTLSKSPTQFVQGLAPRYLARGRGSHVWDVDGNEYVDYPLALGPILLGYAEPVVDDAIRAQLEDGITFTMMHPLEVEVAERIVALCPGVEAVRFGKSGSDAVSAAVRAARAITGRDGVLVAGYHGWHDWFIGSTTRNAGVPGAYQSLVDTFRFNDLEHLAHQLEARRDQVAAVIVEPAGAEAPDAGFLAGVIELAHSHGALAVFDEVITGFRLAPGGARERFGVEPDLSCHGKALGNGMPISAVAGRWKHMRVFEEVFFSGTHGGEALSLAAARAVLDTIADGAVLAGIRTLGTRMFVGMATTVARHGAGDLLRVGGVPERTIVGCAGPDAAVLRTWLQQCMLEDGVLYNGSMFICARHTDDDIDRGLAAFDRAVAAVATGDDLRPHLRGPVLEPVFREP